MRLPLGVCSCSPERLVGKKGDASLADQVSVITFDADGTLCDFQRLMAAALAAALAQLQR